MSSFRETGKVKAKKKWQRCLHCRDKTPTVKKRRQMTSYVDDRSNWSRLCDDCQKDSDEYWTEMWDEYYRGRL